MFGYDRVILYNSETRGFCEGPLLCVDVEACSPGSVCRLNIDTYIDNEFKDEEEVIHVVVEHQKDLDRLKKELKEVEYQLKCSEKKLDELKALGVGSEKQAFDWRYK